MRVRKPVNFLVPCVFFAGAAALIAPIDVAGGETGQGPPSIPSAETTPEAFRNQRLAKLEETQRVLALIDSGKYDDAREIVQAMIDHAPLTIDLVEGYRLLSQLTRRSGDPAGAAALLLVAMNEVEKNDTLRKQAPFLKATILLDQASIARTEMADLDGAVVLYDKVMEEDGPATLWHRRVAAGNAATLRAMQGRLAEALQRSERLLNSGVSQSMDVGERVHWLLAQATWVEQMNDLPGAFARYESIWSQYKDRSEEDVFVAGIQVGRFLPVGMECDRRLSIARKLLAKLQAIRTAAAIPAGAPPAERVDELEQEVLVIIADSGECPGESDFADWARRQLKAPFAPD